MSRHCVASKAARAFELLEKGLSHDVIAERLGIAKSRLWHYLNRGKKLKKREGSSIAGSGENAGQTTLPQVSSDREDPIS